MNSRSRLLLFRRRTSSPILPSFPQITNNVLFLNANDPAMLYSDAAKTVNTVADGNVLVLADKSGQGNDARQDATGKQPIRKVGVLNGGDAVRFDSIDDELECVFGSALSQPLTIFLVMRSTSAVDNRELFMDGVNNYAGRVIVKKENSVWGVQAPSVVDSVTAVDNNWHIFHFVANGASSELFLDGTSIASGNAGSDGLEAITVGSGRGGAAAAMDLRALLIYDRLLNDTEQSQVLAYLSSETGITVS